MLVLAASCLVCLFFPASCFRHVFLPYSFTQLCAVLCVYCISACLSCVLQLNIASYSFLISFAWPMASCRYCSPLCPFSPQPSHTNTLTPERGEVFSKQSLKFPDVHKSTEKTRGKQKRRDRTRTKSGSGQKQVGGSLAVGVGKGMLFFSKNIHFCSHCLGSIFHDLIVVRIHFLSYILQSLKWKHSLCMLWSIPRPASSAALQWQLGSWGLLYSSCMQKNTYFWNNGSCYYCCEKCSYCVLLKRTL